MQAQPLGRALCAQPWPPLPARPRGPASSRWRRALEGAEGRVLPGEPRCPPAPQPSGAGAPWAPGSRPQEPGEEPVRPGMGAACGAQAGAPGCSTGRGAQLPAPHTEHRSQGASPGCDLGFQAVLTRPSPNLRV